MHEYKRDVFAVKVLFEETAYYLDQVCTRIIYQIESRFAEL